MQKFTRAGAIMAALVAALAAQAQDSDQPAPDESLAQPQLYVAAEHGDWELRCLETDAAFDPCQLYQLMEDEEGNSVAEITLFPLPGDSRAVVGATIATPLDTLLTRQVTISIDDGIARRYPFTYCSVQGCFSRIGFTQEEVDALRRGNAAKIIIVPLAATDTEVVLTMSLKGFTAGHNALLALQDQTGDN